MTSFFRRELAVTLGATALAILLATGCSSERPPEERLAPLPRMPKEPDPFEAGAAPVSVVAPVSSWRQALAAAAPTTFAVGEPTDRIDAPTGWMRRAGDRGLRFEFEGPSGERGIVTLMPEGFEGRSEELGCDFAENRMTKKGRARPGCDGTTPELPFGPTSEGWTIFFGTTPKSWPGFEADVARALGARRTGA